MLTSCLGDLGSNPKDVETALQTNFALANRWGCILLLDEADVFLAERRREDFNRNGLVAGKSLQLTPLPRGDSKPPAEQDIISTNTDPIIRRSLPPSSRILRRYSLSYY